MKIDGIRKRKTKIDRLELLHLVKELGSISAAAKSLGVSYKAAWEAVEQINNMSSQPILERKTGGQGGGGTVFTEHGLNFLKYMQNFDDRFQAFVSGLGTAEDGLQMLNQYMRAIKFATSADNQFAGRIVDLTPGPVNSEVILDIGDQDRIVALVSNHNVQSLGLRPGIEAYALIKSSSIIVTKETGFKSSARNHLVGKVSRLELDGVNGEVGIQLAGGKTVTAVITSASARNMNICIGDSLSALVKATQVILATA